MLHQATNRIHANQNTETFPPRDDSPVGPRDDRAGSCADACPAPPRSGKAPLQNRRVRLVPRQVNLDILERVGAKAVQVYYDVRNANDRGYDIYQEIRTLGQRICAHWKCLRGILDA
jgi:hypothetical protein